MRRHKIPIDKVQEAFNSAIKRRDGRCMVRDYEPCCGELECSHFFTTGASPALRFYPMNAWTQCSKHHQRHHTLWKHDDPWNYKRWIMLDHFVEFDWMYRHRNSFIKYTDELKAEIIRLCNADKLDELQKLIEEKLRRI